MIRLALKNLWARKRRNGWLMAELIVVSLILWHFADPVTVQTYVNMLPDGFTSENLYRISIQEYDPSSYRYREEAAESETRQENMWRIRDRVRNYPGVESATFQIGGGGPGGRSYSATSSQVTEDISVYHIQVDFVPKSDYFTTFLTTKYTKEELENPTEELQSEIKELTIDYATDLLSKKPVWFMISNLFGKYYIIMYYDNVYNQAQGEDL